MKTSLQILFFISLITRLCVAQWLPQASGTTKSLNSIFFIDSLSGWAAGEEGEIIMTSDGGNNWNPQVIGNIEYLSSVFFISETEGWAAGGNFEPLVQGIIYHSTDAGNQWTLQTDTIPLPLTSIYFVSQSVGWAVGVANQVLKTTNGGSDWFTQVGDDADFREIFFISENIGWIVGGNPFNTLSKILKTTDGGDNWIIQTANTNNYLRAVHFISETTGWVAGNNGTIFKTTDGGTNWIEQVSGTTDGLYSIAFVSNDTGWIAGGGEGLILFTSDGGTTWMPQNSGTNQWLSSIFFNSPGNGWVTGNSGIILHTTNGGVTFIDEDELNEIPAEFLLSQNYPNPFNPSTKIKYSIPTSPSLPLFTKESAGISFVILKVYDILGREVAALVNEEQSAGVYEVNWDAANLPSGVYFYQLKASEFVDTKKMIILQ